MQKKVLLTGSSGFLGSQMCIDLLKKDFNITAIDIKRNKNELSEITYILKDVGEYLDTLDNLDNFDIVIHAASVLPYKSSEYDIWEKNFLVTKKLVNKLSKSKEIFFIYISSSAVYGKPLSVPVDKDTPLNPLDTYGHSKVKSESFILNMLEKKSFSIIRPRTILGLNRSGIFDIFFNLIKYRIPLPIPNKGSQQIQFVDVKDLSRLTIHIAEKAAYGIWPAAGPETKSLKFLLNNLGDNLERKIVILNINTFIFKFIGRVLILLNLTNFTSWHFGAFPHDFYFKDSWTPEGFKYEFTSNEAFENTARKFFE
ncbi:SDR family oxidoreductase [Acidimicrobiia bacterium]|nr:SDR family oxidoreductase [Acidimicrobiia bacterium]